MISEQNWPKHKTIWCKKVQFKIGLNAKCAIVQNWPVHGKPVQNDDQYKFGTNANCAGTKQSVQNVPVQIGQNKVSTSQQWTFNLPSEFCLFLFLFPSL